MNINIFNEISRITYNYTNINGYLKYNYNDIISLTDEGFIINHVKVKFN